MADEPTEIFSINANDILVKLHLAAASQLQSEKVLIKNAAVQNDSEHDTPENIGNSVADISDGPDFEVALFLSAKYVPAYDELDKNYKNTVLSKQKNDVENEDEEKLFKQLDNENTSRKNKRDKMLQELKNKALKLFKTYFLNFAGKQVSSKLTPKEITMLPCSEVNSLADIKVKKGKVFVDDKKLNELRKKTIEKFNKDAETKTKDLAKDQITMTYCFKTGYSILFGKK